MIPEVSECSNENNWMVPKVKLLFDNRVPRTIFLQFAIFLLKSWQHGIWAVAFQFYIASEKLIIIINRFMYITSILTPFLVTKCELLPIANSFCSDMQQLQDYKFLILPFTKGEEGTTAGKLVWWGPLKMKDTVYVIFLHL